MWTRYFSDWRRRSLVFVVALLLAPLSSYAQNTAPLFSHGPTIPFVLVEKDSTNTWTSNMLAAGAGYSLNINVLSNLDGTVKWLTIGIPQFVQLPQGGQFFYGSGLTLGTFNNLVSFGAIVPFVDTVSQRGAFLGSVRGSDVKLVFSFGFNFGSGQSLPPEARLSTMQGPGAAAVPVEPSPPPCYVKW